MDLYNTITWEERLPLRSFLAVSDMLHIKFKFLQKTKFTCVFMMHSFSAVENPSSGHYFIPLCVSARVCMNVWGCRCACDVKV